MIIIIGLIVFFVALVAGMVGVLGNAGNAHPLAENFSVFGYHVTGSTGTLFLFGIVVGAVAMLGMSALLAGASRSARRGRDARRDLRQSQRETAYLSRDREALLETQGTIHDTRRSPDSWLRNRWPRHRRPLVTNSLAQPGSTDPVQ